MELIKSLLNPIPMEKAHIKYGIYQHRETIVYPDGTKEEIVMSSSESHTRCDCPIGENHKEFSET